MRRDLNGENGRDLRRRSGLFQKNKLTFNWICYGTFNDIIHLLGSQFLSPSPFSLSFSPATITNNTHAPPDAEDTY
jgi:hypothetical protein